MGEKLDRFQSEVRRVTEQQDEYVNPVNAEAIKKFIDAYNEDNIVETPPKGEQTLSVTTLTPYSSKLRGFAKELDLLDTTEIEIKELLQRFKEGSLANVKEGGLANGSLRLYAIALQKFYRLHSDAGIDPSEIPTIKQESKSVDPSDMLTRDEIQSLRSVATNIRNAAFFDFLLYTGQRITAARTIKIKHIKLESGRFRLNEDAKGLKGATENGTWRDLLLSEASIKQWLRKGHPDPDNPEAYVFCRLTGDNKESHAVSSQTLHNIITKMKEKVGLQKPLHPHALRHNFVTIALRRGVPESSIKHQLGHSPSSRVMETTYAHLRDSDHIRQARKAFDLETEKVESELTPEVCPRCGENPPQEARVCPWCGLEYTPDAKEVMEKADDAVRESYQEVDDGEELDNLQTVDSVLTQIQDDPELKGKLIDELKEELKQEMIGDLT